MRTLAKRNPAIFRTFPSVFDDFFGNDWLETSKAFQPTIPAVNVIEKEDSFQLDVAVPGMKKESINIDLDNDVLTVYSEQKDEKETSEEGKYTRREFHYSSFKRSFTIPESVDADNINARYEDGVLKIDLPKRKEVLKPGAKTIAIQ